MKGCGIININHFVIFKENLCEYEYNKKIELFDK